MRDLVAFVLAVTFFCSDVADNWGAEPHVRFNLLTLPSARSAVNRLAAPAQIAYENVTLRASIAQLAYHYQFSYWIDRRVDADRLISLTVHDATVGECVSGLAKLCDADMGLVENVVTIAPPDRLAAMQYTAVRLHDQLSRATSTPDHQAQMLPLEWEMLTTPTELAAQIATDWGLEFKVALPHDLMNAGRLQPCTLATQLTLLLGGFDQCAVGRSADELRIAQLPMAAPWQTVYAKADIPITQLANWPAIAADFPNARLSQEGSAITVSGPTAAHLRLLAAGKPVLAASAQARSTPRDHPRSGTRTEPRGNPRPDSSTGSAKPPSDPLAAQKITFAKISDQPVNAVIAAMARQMGFDVNWDDSLTAASKMALVTLEAKGESLDAILQRLAAQSGLTITRRGLVVAITPGQKGR